MSFQIGFDIGIVFMKGIVISAITSLTLLPALILVFDKLMNKTKKKAFKPKGQIFCNIDNKANKIIVPIALILIIGGVVQSIPSPMRKLETKRYHKSSETTIPSLSSIKAQRTNQKNS